MRKKGVEERQNAHGKYVDWKTEKANWHAREHLFSDVKYLNNARLKTLKK